MELTTINFFALGGTICLFTSFFLFWSYSKTKRAESLSLAFMPFWLAIHAYAYVLPNKIDPHDLKLLAYGYIIGTAAIFLVQLSGLYVAMFMTKYSNSPTFLTIGGALITTVGVITVSIMLYDFRLPIINETGLIFWNVNKISQLLIGWSSFIYGLVWAYVFYKATTVVMGDSYAKYRLMIISISGGIIGLVALLVHTSTSEFQTLIGHILFIISATMILGIFVIPRRFFVK